MRIYASQQKCIEQDIYFLLENSNAEKLLYKLTEFPYKPLFLHPVQQLLYYFSSIYVADVICLQFRSFGLTFVDFVLVLFLSLTRAQDDIRKEV